MNGRCCLRRSVTTYSCGHVHDNWPADKPYNCAYFTIKDPGLCIDCRPSLDTEGEDSDEVDDPLSSLALDGDGQAHEAHNKKHFSEENAQEDEIDLDEVDKKLLALADESSSEEGSGDSEDEKHLAFADGNDDGDDQEFDIDINIPIDDGMDMDLDLENPATVHCDTADSFNGLQNGLSIAGTAIGSAESEISNKQKGGNQIPKQFACGHYGDSGALNADRTQDCEYCMRRLITDLEKKSRSSAGDKKEGLYKSVMP